MDIMKRFHVFAQNIKSADGSKCIVAFEVAADDNPIDLAAVKQSLEWEIAIFERLTNLNPASSAKLVKVLGLLASCLHHDRFKASAAAVAFQGESGRVIKSTSSGHKSKL